MSNFGLLASPERRLLFRLSRFDETVPGPFDWDVRRLVASIVVASRELGLKKSAIEGIVQTLLDTYHQRMLGFAALKKALKSGAVQARADESEDG